MRSPSGRKLVIYSLYQKVETIRCRMQTLMLQDLLDGIQFLETQCAQQRTELVRGQAAQIAANRSMIVGKHPQLRTQALLIYWASSQQINNLRQRLMHALTEHLLIEGFCNIGQQAERLTARRIVRTSRNLGQNIVDSPPIAQSPLAQSNKIEFCQLLQISVQAVRRSL